MPRWFTGNGAGRERSTLAEALRTETVGGVLLITAAAAALGWANSPWRHGYLRMRAAEWGPSVLHLHVSVDTWAQDGLLAVFFLVAGVELKREFAVGEMRRPSAAALPVAAACCSAVLPVALYLAITAGHPSGRAGWGIPITTDIAFTLAVLAVAGPRAPAALRAFLLTLAVVSDLLAILVIAVFYSAGVKAWPLAGAAALLALYALLQRLRVRAWWLYIPLGVVVWALVHDAGVHATVATVAMGLLTRVRPDEGEQPEDTPGERLEHLARPLSAGLAVPFFALTAAGTPVSGSSLREVFTQRVTLAIVVAMVAGKALGVFGGAFATARLTRARLSPELEWRDVAGVSLLSGVGFTVALLIASLAFPDPSGPGDLAKTVVLAGSVLSAGLGAIQLRRRDRHYRRTTAPPQDERRVAGLSAERSAEG